METNQTILTRKVVSIADRKLLGKVSGQRIDCDALSVSHYIVNSASTNTPLVLPFEAALSVGDTFVTVQSRDEFITNGSPVEKSIVNEGFLLVGIEVFSRTGNRLGTVKSYEFDTVYGLISRIVLDSGVEFSAENFIFFAPEFVFVDDGTETASEMRIHEPAAPSQAGSVKHADTPKAVREDAAASAGGTSPSAVAKPEDVQPEKETSATSDHESSDEVKADDADADLVEFLLGATLAEDVTSEDGQFKCAKGKKLSEKDIEQARIHGALLLLTMSVED